MQTLPPSSQAHANVDAAGSVYCDQTPAEMSETEALTWELLDGIIERTGFQKLEALLLESEAARQEYVSVVQLHSGLQELSGNFDMPSA